MKKATKVAVVGVAIAVSIFVMATAGADININIPTTPAQDAKLVRVLDYLNQDREVPYANIEEALKDRLVRDAKQLIRTLDEREHKRIFIAWEAADEATKDQIRALLNVQ